MSAIPQRKSHFFVLESLYYFSCYCASLAEERKKEDGQLARLATCQCGIPAMFSSNANSLVADENNQD